MGNVLVEEEQEVGRIVGGDNGEFIMSTLSWSTVFRKISLVLINRTM